MPQYENRWAGRAAAPYVIGVDLGGTNIRAALTDREGRILKEARGARHMVMITVGTGIGGAFVVDGRLLLGPNGSIGEVGHHTIDPQGPLCGCGNHGCWERFCGRDAIVDRTVRLLQRGRPSALMEQVERPADLTPALVAHAAAAGD